MVFCFVSVFGMLFRRLCFGGCASWTVCLVMAVHGWLGDTKRERATRERERGRERERERERADGGRGGGGRRRRFRI